MGCWPGYRGSRLSCRALSTGSTLCRRPDAAWEDASVTVDVWTSIGTWVTAIGTVAMAAAVIVTAIYARGTLRATREDSRARTRPVMIAELVPEHLSHGTTLLLVRNAGASVASDVTVTFDPAPPADVDALPDTDMWKWLYQRYSQPVPTWAPGWTLSSVIRAGHDPLDPVSVTLSYRGPDGYYYSDVYALQPDHVMKATSSTPSKVTDPVKLDQQKISALQALVRTLRER